MVAEAPDHAGRATSRMAATAKNDGTMSKRVTMMVLMTAPAAAHSHRPMAAGCVRREWAVTRAAMMARSKTRHSPTNATA